MNSSEQMPFLITKEYRKFAEFCDACRQDKYIGLCYGFPGVGKTLSARYFSMWDSIEYYFSIYNNSKEIKWSDVVNKYSIFYTPRATTSMRSLESEIEKTIFEFNILIYRAEYELKLSGKNYITEDNIKSCELIIIDEVD